jgi:uncharacterized protein (DUF1697 family)
MNTYIALLRGVNVGTGRRVPMADLRDLLTRLGLSDARTLLNSGNAVFGAAGGSAAAQAKAIAAAIQAQLGLAVPVIVKSARQLAAIVDENPWGPGAADSAVDPARLLVVFTQDAASLAALRAIEALVVAPEAFHVGRHAAFLHCPAGILESRAGAALLGKAGRAATTRNWATVRKLQAMCVPELS